MNGWKLAIRSLRYYWRTNVGVVLGLAVSTVILVGSLLVGDSVRYSLLRLAELRVGRVEYAVTTGDRFAMADLADRMESRLGDGVVAAPVLMAMGSVGLPSAERRISGVQVLGVDERFGALAPEAWPVTEDQLRGKVFFSEALAKTMPVQPGEALLFRLGRAGAIPMDAPLSSDQDTIVAWRLEYGGVVPDGQFGRFHMQANQIAPLNAFVSLTELGEQIDRPQRCNLVLLGKASDSEKATVELTTDAVRTALLDSWDVKDIELEIRDIPEHSLLEIRSPRVFLDSAVEQAAMAVAPEGYPVLTYLANSLRVSGHSTPYSIVSAVPSSRLGEWTGLDPSRVGPGTIVISPWLEEDSGAEPDRSLEMTYYVMGDRRSFEEKSVFLKVAAVLPSENGPWADPSLMPDFPGITDSDNCREWEAGFPLDLDRIRPVDEEYWDEYGGTPKAFISLEQGREIWGNRFGQITAIRIPASAVDSAELEQELKEQLEPESFGLQVRPLREQAMRAGRQSMSFSSLFVSFSIFLVVAALLLSGLLYVFSVDRRSAQIGSLMAMGFTPGHVIRLFIREAMVLSLIGTAVGTLVAVGYTRVVLWGLGTVWRDLIGTTTIVFHGTPAGYLGGALGGFFVGLLAIYWAIRGKAKRSVQEILTTQVSNVQTSRVRVGRRRWPAIALGLLAALAAIGCFVGGIFAGGSSSGAVFFSSGALLLFCGVVWFGAVLKVVAGKGGDRSPGALGLMLRNLARRRGRSLATTTLLAAGAFMVIGVEAYRLDARQDAGRRDSGTGGFDLFIDLTQPVYRDLSEQDDQEHLGLDSTVLDGIDVCQLRVQPGDDASCLNLNKAQQPRLLGVNPKALGGRFSFVKITEEAQSKGVAPWTMLDLELPDGAIPAIADYNTILWALGKAPGARLAYQDEHGNTFQVALVGALANSVLQGNILIAEKQLVEHYPSASGYRWILVDAPDAEPLDPVRQELEYGLETYGVSIETTVRRLASFNAVQNTYLSVFQVLSGLGVILGSFGLGCVVLRNLFERRSELALMQAVGFTRKRLNWMVLGEHLILLLIGLALGIAAAAVAVVPGLMQMPRSMPWWTLAIALGLIVANGLIWTMAAARFSLRGSLIDSLRNE
jgi:ABC-type antimicrobial peptide transport system permease subunit